MPSRQARELGWVRADDIVGVSRLHTPRPEDLVPTPAATRRRHNARHRDAIAYMLDAIDYCVERGWRLEIAGPWAATWSIIPNASEPARPDLITWVPKRGRYREFIDPGLPPSARFAVYGVDQLTRLLDHRHPTQWASWRRAAGLTKNASGGSWTPPADPPG
ncbi:MAG: hypothetical protein AAFR52_11315 [Pseudomonadota bacterium]